MTNDDEPVTVATDFNAHEPENAKEYRIPAQPDMNSFEVIELARKHVNNESPMRSSAQLCLADAEELQRMGRCTAARNRAVKSLEYSVGILHPDYKACAK